MGDLERVLMQKVVKKRVKSGRNVADYDVARRG